MVTTGEKQSNLIEKKDSKDKKGERDRETEREMYNNKNPTNKVK
jgi:hypothetical protein